MKSKLHKHAAIFTIMASSMLSSCGQQGNISLSNSQISAASLDRDSIEYVDTSAAYNPDQTGYTYLDAAKTESGATIARENYPLSPELASSPSVCPNPTGPISTMSVNSSAVSCTDGSTKAVEARKTVSISSRQTLVVSAPYKSNPIGPQTLQLTSSYTLSVTLSGTIKVVNASGSGSGTGSKTQTFIAYACLWQQDTVRNRYISFQNYVKYKNDPVWYKDGAPYEVQQQAQSGDVSTKTLSGFVCGGPTKA